MNKAKSKEGITIIELMVGMVAFGILALTVGSMLVFGWAGWRRNTDTVALQRNAMIAMRVIEHRIRNAEAGDVGWSTDQITFLNDTDYDKSEIIPGTDVAIESFNVNSNDYGGISVEFSLGTTGGTYSKNFKMTVYPRN